MRSACEHNKHAHKRLFVMKLIIFEIMFRKNVGRKAQEIKSGAYEDGISNTHPVV